MSRDVTGGDRLARRLRDIVTDARRATGADMATVAREAGLAVPTVTRFVHGEHQPTLTTLVALAGWAGYAVTFTPKPRGGAGP